MGGPPTPPRYATAKPEHIRAQVFLRGPYKITPSCGFFGEKVQDTILSFSSSTKGEEGGPFEPNATVKHTVCSVYS